MKKKNQFKNKIVICMATLKQENLYRKYQIFKNITNKSNNNNNNNPSIAQSEYLTCQILFFMNYIF